MKSWIIKLLTLMLLPLSVGAATVPHLYEADVDVASNSAKVRQHVLPQALQQVLVKVSGNPAIATLPDIQQQLKRASQLMQQYQYHEVDVGKAKQRKMLRVRFVKADIQHLLQHAGQAVWSSERPLLAVWLVDSDQQLLTSDTATPLLQVLQQAAARRGLALAIPLGDLSELNQISYQDVQQENVALLHQASKRYGADGLLIASIDSASHAQWTLWQEGERQTWQSTGDDAGQLVKQGIDNIADFLAARYAALPPTLEQDNKALITVFGINNATDYTALNNYLHTIESISDIQIMRAAADRVDFQLSLENGIPTLLQALKSQHRLVMVDEARQDEQHFYYRFIS